MLAYRPPGFFLTRVAPAQAGFRELCSFSPYPHPMPMFTLLRSLIQSLTGKNGRRAALMLALGAVSLRAAATDYYVSSTGSNSNPGTSTSPWQTIARVNSQVFLPGDRVLFEGGRTFAGPMLLDSGDGGSAT
jgi:hypothetical protein